MIESYLELIGATTRAAHEHEVLIASRSTRGAPATAGETPACGRWSSKPSESPRGSRRPRSRCSARSGRVSSRASCEPRSIRTPAPNWPRSRRPTPTRHGPSEANAWPLGATRALGALPHRRCAARDVLDRRVAAGRRLADVHGRPAGPLEPRANGGGHVRADRARALDPGGRGGDHPRSRRPRAAPPLRSGRDRAPAPGPGSRRAPGGRAGGRARRGAAGRVRHGHRARPDDLRRACAEVHEQAVRARLELHRMYGQQADAFAFTLPLCRGLR